MHSIRPLSKVVLDASVIINFANVNRLHFLLRLIDNILLVPTVMSEVTNEYQRSALANFLTESQCSVLDDDAVSVNAIMLASYSGLGRGESFAYHHAVNLDCDLATDDRRAIRIFSSFSENLTIITSVDILKVLVTQGIIDNREAEDIVAQWTSLYRFRVDWPS